MRKFVSHAQNADTNLSNLSCIAKNKNFNKEPKQKMITKKG